MSLDNVLSEVAGSVPECLAIGYVDAASGMLLAIRTVDSHPREVIDLVAAATADLFNGPNVSMIESLFKKSRGLKDDGHHYFQELIVNSDNLIDRKSTRLNSSHLVISYAVFCLKKKKTVRIRLSIL